MTIEGDQPTTVPDEDGPSLTPEQTFALLESLAPDGTLIESSVTWRFDDKGADRRACLEMTIVEHPERRAWIQSSGDTWFDLSIDGGFGTAVISEDATADEARGYIADWVEMGVSYLRNGAISSTWRFFGVPVRLIARDGREPLRLHMDIRDELRFVFRKWPRLR